MKFKILTVRSLEHVQQEIDYFKLFCDESRIKDIRIAEGGGGFVITIVYERSWILLELNMENKIWLTNGKYVSAEDLIEVMFSDRGYAANIILKIKDDKIRVLATKALLSIPQTSGVSKSNTSLAEDIFHDFTFGLFE